MKVTLPILILSLLQVPAFADISAAYRQANAYVIYDFAEYTGQVIDKASPTKGAPLNLDIYAPVGAGERGAANAAPIIPAGASRLTLSSANLVRSSAPATKIINACKASGSISVEVWLRNNESVQLRSGQDSARHDQPLRIVSLSENLLRNNFAIGQYYDAGNFYVNAVRTNGNDNPVGNSLTEPLRSNVAATLVPDSSIGRPVPPPQKMVFTLNNTGVARLYLSDMNGYMYQHKTATNGFGAGTTPGAFLAGWFNNAYLTLGNLNMDLATFQQAVSQRSDFAACGTLCANAPNRYWKGDLYLVAVYCNEVPRTEILGAGTDNIIKNVISTAPIPVGMTITPEMLRAQEMFNRLTGAKVPLSDQRIQNMAALITDDPVGAANIATSDPRFLNVTVRDFAAKMSNRAETINVPLNDFTATVIGFVRDNRDARTLLTTDEFYMATNPLEAPVGSSIVDDVLRSNNHYEALDLGRFDLGKVLHPTRQKIINARSGLTAVDNPSPAGLLTTRQWMAEHAIAGTNRRLIEYTFREFLCSPMEAVADNTGPDDVVGRDVDRFPGGSHSKYTSNCRACHTIMDGFRPAFARWTFGNGFAKHAFAVPAIAPAADEDAVVGMQVTPAQPNVATKLNKNETVFPDGRITVDERWVNNARYNSNLTTFKFNAVGGTGTREFGAMISSSPKFARCMAQRVFTQVCKRDIENSDNVFLDNAAADFSKGGFNLRSLFQKIVTGRECLGGVQP